MESTETAFVNSVTPTAVLLSTLVSMHIQKTCYGQISIVLSIS
jgi:hypothetical protein